MIGIDLPKLLKATLILLCHEEDAGRERARPAPDYRYLDPAATSSSPQKSRESRSNELIAG